MMSLTTAIPTREQRWTARTKSWNGGTAQYAATPRPSAMPSARNVRLRFLLACVGDRARVASVRSWGARPSKLRTLGCDDGRARKAPMSRADVPSPGPAIRRDGPQPARESRGLAARAAIDVCANWRGPAPARSACQLAWWARMRGAREVAKSTSQTHSPRRRRRLMLPLSRSQWLQATRGATPNVDE